MISNFERKYGKYAVKNLTLYLLFYLLNNLIYYLIYF